MENREKTHERLLEELKALREKNTRLESLIGNSRDMLFRMSLPDGRYEYASPASYDLTGYSPEEFYSSPMLIKEIIHPDWREYLEQQWQRLLAGDMASTYEFRIIHKSGDEKWLFQKNVLIRGNSGKPAAIEGIVTDITERKEIEEALRSNVKRLLEVQKMVRLGHWFWDVKSGDVEWSREVYDIFRLDPTGFTPKIDSILSLSPWPEEQKRGEELIQKAIKSRTQGGYEQKFLFPDGGIGYYFSTFQGIYDKSGDLLAIRGTVQDITERKQVEEALRNSEARFRDLVEMLPEAVYETVRDDTITFANRRALEMFGYSQEDLDRGLRGLDMIAPEGRDRMRENMERLLKGKEFGTVEHMAVKKDGTVFPVLSHASLILKEGEISGIRGVIVDITEQKRAREEKERLEEQYRQTQKVESIGRLAGGVAHDLNNLLTPILGYGEMLRDDFITDDKLKEPVIEIVNAGVRAKDLVSQLLAFSRKQTLEYKTLDMNDIINRIEKLLRRTIRENIEIDIALSSTPQTIQADVVQIEQIILNLAVNAQDAMPEGGTLVIETASVALDESYMENHFDIEPGDYVLLTISDTGHGMDEDTRKQVFEPFFSTKGKLGTGLGLATVYGIVKQHGGNILVYSEPGKGTTVKVYLPFSEVEGSERIAREKNTRDLRGSETVLLVEDNNAVRHLTRAMLKQQGYTVLDTENGDKALKRLEEYEDTVHLLLTDVVMPGMDGRQLFHAAVNKCPGLKVLYTSGYTDNVIAHHGILDEGVEFIQKPFSKRALAKRVRDVLDKD